MLPDWVIRTLFQTILSELIRFPLQLLFYLNRSWCPESPRAAQRLPSLTFLG